MAQEIVGYLDYLTNNGERYFPYTRVEGIINTDGNPFTNWMSEINIHNHDGRYAAITHSHDTRYSLKSHTHDTYALSDHTHEYAGSATAGGAANTALALDKAFTLTIEGSEVGSVDIKGDENVTLSLSVNHEHPQYIKNTGDNIITTGDGVESALAIISDGGRAKIDLYDSVSTDRSYIEFADGKLRFAYNEVPFDITTTGVYFNNKQLATLEDVLNSATGGGSVDMDLLKEVFAEKEHTHTVSNISNFPSTLPNPYKIIFNVNGTPYEYDGSLELTVPLDEQSLNCAPLDHNHDDVYALTDHTHDMRYLMLDGSNHYSGRNLTIADLEPSDYTDDGTVPTEDSYLSRGIRFLDGYNGGTIGAKYTYYASEGKSSVNSLYMSLGNYNSRLSLLGNGVYFNDYEVLHRGLTDIDANSLSGKSIDNLPYIKGTEDMINLGNDSKSKIVLDVSSTTKTEINIRNANGYFANVSVSETSTDVVISIKSGDTSMFTITKDKSTNEVRTDLYGSIYVNGVELSV